MRFTKLYSLFSSDPNNSLKRPYIEYTVIFLLLINVILIIYLAFKLYSLCRKKPRSYFEKKNRRYRVSIFILIFLALLLRGAFEGDQIYNTVSYDTSTHLSPGVLIIDGLPSLLFVSIACAFSYFWHELYSSFDDYTQVTERTNTKLKILLISVNVVLYVTFIACSILRLSQESKTLTLIIRIMCLLSLIFSTAMLKIHGSRLYYRALKLFSYTGQNAKSSGFRKMYIIIMICCVLKLIKEGIIFYFSFTTGEDLLQDLDNIQQGVYLAIFIAYVVVFYVFGEYGMYLSLILLLDSYANKSRISFGSEEIDRKPNESYLLDAEDVHVYTASSSRVVPTEAIQEREVIVRFA